MVLSSVILYPGLIFTLFPTRSSETILRSVPHIFRPGRERDRQKQLHFSFRSRSSKNVPHLFLKSIVPFTREIERWIVNTHLCATHSCARGLAHTHSIMCAGQSHTAVCNLGAGRRTGPHALTHIHTDVCCNTRVCEHTPTCMWYTVPVF